ncbi:hypothetical protein ASPTUDRAFT_195207 [Aspergillus tubingensis CBS 134.48]|uniref:Ricin B lectin domain-containing protein n=1 Tax=Aspergillus tubingensis (strain CBS 134.48) TaxID=767770 RepID=A0A1L9NKF4_ASPTC|nr:hypothetical protein ASPTUDRAFT_195207 [Aspergillus tubingensis CBS 134.48]
MPIPKEGETFRLLNYGTNSVLVANTGIGEGALTSYKGKVYEDQIFELIPRSDGTFYIQTVYVTSADRYGQIFSLPGAVGVAYTYDDVDSKHFTFEEGSSNRAGWYRLVTPAFNLVLTGKPWNYHADGEKYDDQYFKFETDYGEVTKSADA